MSTKPTAGASAPITAASLFEAAFHPYREPRSNAYKAGALSALRLHLGEAEHICCPFEAGTSEADAFFSGIQEGLALARIVAEEVRHG